MALLYSFSHSPQKCSVDLHSLWCYNAHRVAGETPRSAEGERVYRNSQAQKTVTHVKPLESSHGTPTEQGSDANLAGRWTEEAGLPTVYFYFCLRQITAPIYRLMDNL